MPNLTIKDIAKAANVSPATVSRVLSGSAAISEETRARVMSLCTSMGYTKNIIARSMVVRKTGVLGLILPSIDNPFMSELANHIERTAREKGYSLMLSNSSGDHAREREAFLLHIGRQVDGVVVFPVGADSVEGLKQLLPRVPTVFVNENLGAAPYSYVAVDNACGMRLATEYLIELGHTEILYLGRQTASSAHRQRVEGYLSACRAHGITPLFWDAHAGETSIDAGYALARTLFLPGVPQATAILAATDTLALGVLQAANERGVRIPSDVSLFGFDNIRYAELPTINLSTVDQPRARMAEIAVGLLVDLIDNPDAVYSHQTLLPSLVKRGSCALPRTNTD